MNFIHHQLAARQHGVTQVGMAHLQCPKQSLVNGANGNRRGEEAFGRFCSPALMGFCIIWDV